MCKLREQLQPTTTLWLINRLLSLSFLLVSPLSLHFPPFVFLLTVPTRGISTVVRIVWRQLEKTTCFECTTLTKVIDLPFCLSLLFPLLPLFSLYSFHLSPSLFIPSLHLTLSIRGAHYIVYFLSSSRDQLAQ